MLRAALRLRWRFEVLALTRDGVVIGSSRSCDLRDPDASVAPRHCRVAVMHDEVVVIEDLNSSSGTYVNGERIASRQRLVAGDRISCGESALSLVYEHVADEPEDSTPDPRATQMRLVELGSTLDTVRAQRDELSRQLEDSGRARRALEQDKRGLAREHERLTAELDAAGPAKVELASCRAALQAVTRENHEYATTRIADASLIEELRAVIDVLQRRLAAREGIG
jgi:pSer/pThr/pTyr-binding forkhead associated (FHA) protein